MLFWGIVSAFILFYDLNDSLSSSFRFVIISGYNLSVSLAFLTLALLNYNLYSWTRSYKERVIKVEYRNREGAVHV